MQDLTPLKCTALDHTSGARGAPSLQPPQHHPLSAPPALHVESAGFVGAVFHLAQLTLGTPPYLKNLTETGRLRCLPQPGSTLGLRIKRVLVPRTPSGCG